MRKLMLNENVRNEVLSVIKNNENYGNNEKENVIKELKSNLDISKLFCNELTLKDYDKISYMYHELDTNMLSSFCKISLVEEKGYHTIELYKVEQNKDYKIILNSKYNIEYKGISFVFFVISEFTTFRLKYSESFLEPWIFMEDNAEVYLILEDKVVFYDRFNFDISKGEYLKNISELEVCIRPQMKSREYEIVVIENETTNFTRQKGDFNEVVKNIINILLEDSENIKLERDLIIEKRETDSMIINIDTVSDILYGNLKVGQIITKRDVLYKYELTFRIEGIEKYVKVLIHLNEEEYENGGKVKIKDLIIPESTIEKVDMKDSLYTKKDLYLFSSGNYSKYDIIKLYTNGISHNKNKREKRAIIYVLLSENIISKPNVIEITNKELPFPNVILYNNVLNKTKIKNIGYPEYDIYDIFEGKFIFVNNNFYIVNKYIIIFEGKAYEVELASQLEQAVYDNEMFVINLPVFFNKKVIVNYREIISVDMLDNITSSYMFYLNENDKKTCNLSETYLSVGIGFIKSDIYKNYEKYFENIDIGFERKNNNFIDELEKTLSFDKNLNMYDAFFTFDKSDVKSIKIAQKLYLKDDDDYKEKEKVDIFAEEYYIGKARFEKYNPLELRIKDYNGNSKSIVEFNISEAKLGLKESLYTLFLDTRLSYELESVKIDKSDKLTKEYIMAILDLCNV